MKNPLFSIITICYNSEGTIYQTLKSVADQNLDACLIEHIVVDGSSSDYTLSIVKQFPNVKLISETDQGISDAFNKGLGLSKGKWIFFLNSDDWLIANDILKRVSPYLKENPKKLIIYGGINLVDKKGKTILRQHLKKITFKRLRYSMCLPHQAALTNRSFFERYGRFDLRIKIAMDYELLMRAIKEGLAEDDTLFIPHCISNMREGGVSEKNKLYKAPMDRYWIHKRHQVFVWPKPELLLFIRVSKGIVALLLKRVYLFETIKKTISWKPSKY